MAASQSAAPPRARLSLHTVGGMALDDFAEREMKVIVQRESEHGLTCPRDVTGGPVSRDWGVRMFNIPDWLAARRNGERRMACLAEARLRSERAKDGLPSVAQSEVGGAKDGAPSKTRTCDLLVRSQTLYPTELWARNEQTLESNIGETWSSWVAWGNTPRSPPIPTIPL